MSARAELAPFRAEVDAPFDRDRANRLLSRAGFGASSRALDAAVAAGAEATLDALLHPPRAAASMAEPVRGGDLRGAQAWWMAQMRSGADPLRERMTLFWHDHFATSVRKPLPLALALRQNELLRWRGLGSFGVLLGEVLRDPAMILWLDGHLNARGSPNENLAREVLELFALGHGHYDQGDVRELARALTGWRVDLDRARFHAPSHDDDPKRLLGTRGVRGLDDALGVLLAFPRCARHVVERVWEHFVGPAPQEAVLEELAADFRADGLHVGRLVERLLRSRAFLAPARLPARLASPVELVQITIRRLELRGDPARLAALAGAMGQELLAPPSVAGWPRDREWLSTTWCLRRMELGAVLLRDAPGSLPAEAVSDPVGWVAGLCCVDEPGRRAVREAAGRLGRRSPAAMVAALLTLPETQLL